MNNIDESITKKIMDAVGSKEDMKTFMDVSIMLESRQVAVGVNSYEDPVDEYMRAVSIHIYYNKYDDVNDKRKVELCNILGCLYLSGDALADGNSPEQLLDDFNLDMFNTVMTVVNADRRSQYGLIDYDSVLYIEDVYRMNTSIDFNDLYAFIMRNIDNIFYKLFNIHPDIICMGIQGEKPDWVDYLDNAVVLSTDTKDYSVLSISN